MATSALITRPHDRYGTIGVLLHSDAEITDAGRLLYQQIRTLLDDGADIDQAWTRLIDAHPGGYRHLGESPDTNQCYCHDRGEGTDHALIVGAAAAARTGADYTYLIAPGHFQITVHDTNSVLGFPWTADPDWNWLDRIARHFWN